MLIRVNNFVEDDVNQSNSVEMMASWQLWLASHDAFVSLDSGSNSLQLSVGSFFAMQEPFRWYRIVGDLVTVSQRAIDVGGNFKNNTQYYLYLVDDGDNGTFVLSENAENPSGTIANNSLWVAQFKTKTDGIIDASTIIDSQMKNMNEITNKNTTQDTNITNLTTRITTLENKKIEQMFPVGYIHTQYSTADNPNTIYPKATWSDISSSYNGRYFMASSSNTVGSAINAGLPNLTGSVIFYPNLLYTDSGINGVFGISNNTGETYIRTNSTAKSNFKHLQFNAKNSNTIYGNSNTVTPLTTTIKIWRKTGNITGYSSFALIDEYSIFVDTVELGEDEAGIIGYNPAIHVALPEAMPKALSRDEHNDKVLFFDKESQEWKRVPDDRGKVIYHRDGSQRKCDAVIAVLTDEESFEPFVMPDVDDDITDPA